MAIHIGIKKTVNVFVNDQFMDNYYVYHMVC